MPILLCPNCNASMRELRRNRVSLDICTSCRGVWLDRGELEALVNNILAERTAQQVSVANDRFGARGRRKEDDDDESVLDLVFDLLK